jgi:transposase
MVLEAHSEERRLAMTKSTSGEKRVVKRIPGSVFQRVTTIGVDLGDRFSQWCALDDEGAVVAEGRVATTRAAMAVLFQGITQKRIAMETGTHSPWVSQVLETLGHEVLVANSRKLQLISQNRRKDDRTDARSLARLARFDPQLLYPVRHRSETSQAHLELIRARDVLVTIRTRLVNHLRGAVKPFGLRLPSCTPSAMVKKAPAIIPPALGPAMMPLLEAIKLISVQIAAYDRDIEKLADAEYAASHALRQVGGVGALTALAYMLTLGDRSRFRRSRSVGAWLGLTPARHDSGESQPQMRISKEGDHYVRRLLVGSAQYILGPFGPDCDLRRHGLAIAARGGKNAKRRATVAVARKLAVLLHRLWTTQAEYTPLKQTTSQAAA